MFQLQSVFCFFQGVITAKQATLPPEVKLRQKLSSHGLEKMGPLSPLSGVSKTAWLWFLQNINIL